MATFEGKILKADEKISKKGSPYVRLQIQTANGSEWWTCFSTLQPNSIGATAQFATKEMGDGSIIDEYHITVPGQSQTPTQPNAPATPAATGNIGGHRDMWIFAECYYQHTIAAAYATPPDAADSKTILAESLSAAILANEVFKAYEKDGASAARNLIRSALPDTPEARVAQMQDDAMAGSTDVPPPVPTGEPNHPAFDDDIPF